MLFRSASWHFAAFKQAKFTLEIEIPKFNFTSLSPLKQTGQNSIIEFKHMLIFDMKIPAMMDVGIYLQGAQLK